ncbi:hypothetical protein ACLOJK_022998, partial [Asimina triloba]
RGTEDEVTGPLGPGLGITLLSLSVEWLYTRSLTLKRRYEEALTRRAEPGAKDIIDEADQYELKSAAIRDKLASLTERRQKAWEEYQRLNALCVEMEQLLKAKDESRDKARAEMESFDKAVAELHSRSIAVDVIPPTLKSSD